jgi:hypothetical protein
MNEIDTQELNAIYRNRGYICEICDKPYKYAHILPSTQETRCYECWSESGKSKSWSNPIINEAMNSIELSV